MFELINNSTTLKAAYNTNPKVEFPPFNAINYEALSGDATPLTKSCLLKRKGYGRVLNHMSGVAKAIERVLYIDAGAKNLGGYAYDDTNDAVYAEYWRAEASHVKGIDVIDALQTEDRIFFYVNKNGVSATHISTDAKGFTTSKPLSLAVSKIAGRTVGVSASPLFFLLLVSILNEKSFQSVESQNIRAHYELLRDLHTDYWNNGANDPDTVEKLDEYMRVLENDLYAVCKYECSSDIQDLLDKLNNSVFTTMVNPSVSAEAEKDMHGEIRTPLLVGSKNSRGHRPSSTASAIVKKVSDYVNDKTYFLNENRVLTEEESALVPKLDDVVPPEDVVTKVKLIKASTNSPKPFRNILWIGETGTGKSTAARIAAQMMHLPYTFITINPDTIVSDLYVNVLPAANKTNIRSDAVQLIERAVFDTEGVWFELTGEHKSDVQPSDVIRKVLESEQNGDFMYVESPLVKAFRYGWVCELQEVNYAMKPGVLGGINAALDDIGIIELPTGEIIKRHPDTVIVMTANDGYEGTRKINQAVKSRMTLKGHMELPDSDTLARRAMQNSGYRDMRNIKKMIAVMEGIRRVMEENGETNGSCSVRELQSWCQATEILGDPYEAALSTIVPSATDDPEIQKEVIEALETQFAKRM